MRRAASTIAAAVAVAWAGVTLTACMPWTEPAPSPTPSIASPDLTPTPVAGVACQDRFTAKVEWGTDPATPKSAYLALTNVGDAACSLTGFPTETALLGASGPIETVGYGLDGAPTADAEGRAGEVVTVEPGERAYVWARISRTDARASDDPCRLPVAATGVTLVLPGASEPIVAAADVEVCVDEDADDLQVGPVDSEPRPASGDG
ncbi:hypothetical protein GCM10017608_31300 [Agromyces luteolus]|uniref:DUF4232 domain-containing protein n=1 Tax=Agromyces luteolus TaxID=88373 RepID=A0A7C9HIL0_9MICO|nr:DUF4232 domain-containing protein [Agromyces luteolus]MUN07843.1 DUF4232 domain-containing protein [Agromyces luteolus]GLK29194.1 hypothetical protein GCM10017608_31300 [Agromyces luteolus]